MAKMTSLRYVIERFKQHTILLSITFITLSTYSVKAQPDYEMSLTNGDMISDTEIEFDIVLRAINTTFTLTSYQCSFSFNDAVRNGGELTFSFVEGSSNLSNLPAFGIGVNTFDGDPKLTFASMAGEDLINESTVVVGRFKITNTVPFNNVDPNINWNFGGFVSTIITGDAFQDITNPNNHKSNLALSSRSLNNGLPTEYALYQNYPNPFNPSTTIRISVKSESTIRLTVYNMLGELVSELENAKLTAGNYEYSFDRQNLTSGTYVYRLEADNEIIGTRKMIMLK